MHGEYSIGVEWYVCSSLTRLRSGLQSRISDCDGEDTEQHYRP